LLNSIRKQIGTFFVGLPVETNIVVVDTSQNWKSVRENGSMKRDARNQNRRMCV